MKEYVTGYVIDNFNFEIYQKDICIEKKSLMEILNFHMIGSQIRFVNGKPFKIICEAYLKEGYIYFPSTILKGAVPDILGSLIITGINSVGDSVSLTEDDIRLIEEFISLRYYNKDGVCKSIYSLEVENPTNTNIQTTDLSTLKHMRRVL